MVNWKNEYICYSLFFQRAREIINGEDVLLLDISNNELDIAKRRIKEAGLKAENYYCKSTLELDIFDNDLFDGILLMGSLYHLHIVIKK